MTNLSTEAAVDEPDFESALKELETLVDELESGELPLSDSLKRFERGVTLSRRCHSMLEQARQAVTLLSDPDNAAAEQPFPERAED